MRKVSTEEQKAIQLSVLKEIKSICEKNKICYYLGYGTLLGAVRHKGFIPWDDDIDIIMPRPDYNRFLQLAVSEKFDLYCLEHQKEYIYAFAKACDKNTLVQTEGVRCNLKIGIYVDIFPIDGVGNSVEEAKAFFSKTAFLYGLSIAANWEKYVKGRSGNVKRNTMRFGCYLLSRFVSARSILEKYHSQITQKSYSACQYVAVCVSPYRTKEIMPVSVFGNPVQVSFEGESFNAPANFHVYLKSLYGDYMQLPPENERKNIHQDTAFYK